MATMQGYNSISKIGLISLSVALAVSFMVIGSSSFLVYAVIVDDTEFDSPHDVQLDSAGHVYVADTFNNRIQKFTSTGLFIREWGSLGSGNGQFNLPVGIGLDSAGHV